MKFLHILFCYCLFIQVSIPTFGQDASYNYAEVLQQSMFFYEVQRSGILPTTNRVTWRGNSAEGDGQEVGIDLTGGWYDAGDHVKFGFPMAFSSTALALGGIEYEDGYKQSGQWEYLLESLRWTNDYFIKCHTGPTEFYGQVGNGGLDHAWWGSAEVMEMPRPAYKIDANNPGSDLAAETAAAMASASILFSQEDPAYSQELLEHAKKLYEFADSYRGAYSDAITDAATYYRSWSGYQDELVWGAIWLYLATEDPTYLQKAEAEYAYLSNEPQSEVKSYKWTVAWDDKAYGCYVLLAKITGKAQYMEDAERWLDYWTDGYQGNQINYTPGGLAWLDQWGALRYAANTSLMAFIYSDFVSNPAKKEQYYNFAVNQINYALGNNPANRSFVVGFGNNPPKNPHHRTAHGTWTNNLRNPEESRHILYGALVGGPDLSDTYVDDRGDYIANEVATDYNACFSGALAKMVEDFGGQALPEFPIPELPEDEFFVRVKPNAQTNSFSQIVINIFNHSAWPARALSDFSVRYFMDLSEAFAAGFQLSDLYVKLTYGNNITVGNITQWKEDIYYVEFTFSEKITPTGESPSRAELQFEVGISGNVNQGWDASNDWSFQGVNNNSENHPQGAKTDFIPVYAEGESLSGSEPGAPDPDPNPQPTPGDSCKSNFLSVRGNKLLDARGNEVRLTGVNWFGFETQLNVFHGLFSRDMYSVLKQIKDLGFNTIRLPWSNDMLKPGAKIGSVQVNPSGRDPYTGDPLNPYIAALSSPLEVLDLVIQWCEENNLKIVLDNHSRAADGYLNENLWYTDEVPEEKWIADWVFLADRYKEYAALAVADLNNEPHNGNNINVTWGYGDPAYDWAKAAERCAEAIWEVNPNIVICVEGIQMDKSGKNAWWGGNLADVRDYPLQVSKPDKLIYSHHEYGPEVHNQPWFQVPEFPTNLDTLWDHRWSFIHTQNIGHLLMGEFGIKEENSFGGISKTWISELMEKFGGEFSWTFWCMNPNSGDTGGILQDDWTSINDWKMDILRPYLAAEIPNKIPCDTTPENGVRIAARVLLEGFMDAGTQQMSSELVANNLLPIAQPFNVEPLNYAGLETLAENHGLGIVDWVYVELRSSDDPRSIEAQKACVLSSSGSILDVNGDSTWVFQGVPAGSYHIAVYHKSHLAIITDTPLSLREDEVIAIDFTNIMDSRFLKQMGNVSVMTCGDFNQDGINSNIDFNLWKQNSALVDVYLPIDADGNGVINNLDFNLWKLNGSQLANPLTNK
ncbi:MAG: glycoside hydrolase family 9 protein [Bacteroidota bacterium]